MLALLALLPYAVAVVLLLCILPLSSSWQSKTSTKQDFKLCLPQDDCKTSDLSNIMAIVDEHALLLGKLVANLQSLEFALRAFLVNDEIRSGGSFRQAAGLDKMDEGNVVALNAFTDYDTLRQLIIKYNDIYRISGANLRIDETLADIRDAVAHGRVSASTPSGHLKLLKFSKPKRNEKHVKVTFSVTMTEEGLMYRLAGFTTQS